MQRNIKTLVENTKSSNHIALTEEVEHNSNQHVSSNQVKYMAFPASVRTIGMNAFLDCGCLKSVYLQEGLE